MIDLPGYSLECELGETPASWIYRGRRLCDNRPVLVKTPKPAALGSHEVARYRHEWMLLREAEIDGAAVAIEALLECEVPALVFEDPGGHFLTSRTGRTDLGTFLTIASRLAEIVGQVHAARIAHCNISPANILFDPETETLTLANFSRAVQVKDERVACEPLAVSVERRCDPNLQAVQALAFVAPEQTGRVNWDTDYRTDFYALGVTLFELLTGFLPFRTRDPFELVHAHIAQTPPLASDIDPTIPGPVGAIVGKLLAKMPEDRYQTAWGLQTDLVLCLIQWEATGEIEPLILAEHDAIDRLRLPNRLYGREAELSCLAESFRRIGMFDPTGSIALQSPPELILVSGEGGIGKSSLIAESFKPISPQYGYVLSGRFESNPNELTYAAFVQAAQAFARQLLTETEARVSEWRAHLRESLGPDLPALEQIVPDLRFAIEVETYREPPPIEPTSFLFVLQRFFRALGDSRYPIAILLDDLQWADASTLQFIEELLGDPQVRSLTVVGVYRPDERRSQIEACGMRLRERGASVESIALASLDITSTVALVADTLQQTPKSVVPIASLVYQKTNGNPFFVREFLKTLYNEELLHFDDESKSWQWDLERVRTQAITDNVLDLMLDKLCRLPEQPRRVLSFGAFLGRTFEVNQLAQLCQLSVLEVLHELTPAIVDGLLYPSLSSEPRRDDKSRPVGEASYQFLHDLVRQAAYQATDEAERPGIHLRIGRLLLAELGAPDELEQSRQHLPDLVYQWNAGAAAIDNDRDRIDRARLNLAAAHQAKQEGEYEIALTYCEAGLSALTEVTLDLDASAPYLSLELELEHATLYYLQGKLEQSERCIYKLLPEAERPQDLAALYSLIVVEQTMRGDYEALWQTLNAGAAQLGISLELEDGTPWQEQIAQWPTPLSTISVAEIADSRTAKRSAIATLLEQALAPAALSGRPERLAALVTRLIAQSETPIPELMTAYTVGAILFHTCGEVDRAQVWLAAAQRMVRYCGEPRTMHRMQSIHDIYFAPWHEPLAIVLPRLERLAIDTLDAREIQYSGYIRVASLALGLYRGVGLGELLERLEEVAAFCEYHRDSWALACIARLRAHFQRLQGRETGPPEPTIERERDPDYFDVSIVSALDAVHAIQYCYLAGQEEAAIALASRLDGHTASLFDFIALEQHEFYWGLSIAMSLAPLPLGEAPAPKRVGGDRAALRARLEKLLAQFDKRARRQVVEHECQYALLAAEIARVDGRVLEALDGYERAIAIAERGQFDHYGAIAKELTARLWLSRDNTSVARVYLQEAHGLYVNWGCQLRAVAIERHAAALLSPRIALAEPAAEIAVATPTAKPRSLREMPSQSHLNRTFDRRPTREVVFDIDTAIKTSQILAGEMDLDRLLDKLMKLVLANAGATSGSLSLERDGIFAVVAIERGGAPADGEEQLPTPANASLVPSSVLNYSARTGRNVLLNDVRADRTFANDPYIQRVRPKSILCSPIQGHGQLLGVLYLENVLTAGAFTDDRLGLLMLICAQAAIALENAQLYDTLRQSEQRERERAIELDRSFAELQETQLQLVQSEKMATLGQLVAGVAHEINNPIGFIDANLNHARGYVDDLLELIGHYQAAPGEDTEEIEAALEDLEFEFISEDLPKLLSSMKVGTDRIRQISKSLRTFSRSDTSRPVAVNLHEGLDSTLMILKPRLKFTDRRTSVEVVQTYGELPEVVCYAGQLNQVFTNTIANAVDAFDELAERYADCHADDTPLPEDFFWEGKKLSGCRISIETSVRDDREAVIRICDNGPGMPPEVRDRIFERLFTTKDVNKGTGLGLSISHQIVVDTHGGCLTCESELGRGTVFEVAIPLDVTSAWPEDVEDNSPSPT
ncbi:MAG: AAA family ATPase [Geitlerinemataceae cyanobacterium]